MNRVLYRLLIFLFPAELRARWEEEMVDTFAKQVSDARQEAGWAGVARTWWYAVAEIFPIALPMRLSRGAVAVPVISVASSGAIFFGLIWAL